MAKLALNGGTKVTEGVIMKPWPHLRPEDEAAVVDALRKGYWGGVGR